MTPRTPLTRLRVAQWFALALGALAMVGVTGVVTGVLALDRLADDRRLTADRLDPAMSAALRLTNALVNQDSGVRGFVLTGDRAFLEPFLRGRTEEPAAREDLVRLTGGIDPDLRRRVEETGAVADRWRTTFALPLVERVQAGDAPAGGELARGRRLFGEVRRAATGLTGALTAARDRSRARLADTAETVDRVFLVFGLLLTLTIVLGAVVLRRVVVAPIGRLAEQVRSVTRGDFSQPITADGAREVAMLGSDVEAMRARILAERDELARSNAELEQFAYVASHDLQEPLRKVASFTQMLQRRYGGQLDERADTYIEFAVDGAKRMQDLINDLLAFSRVGRVGQPQVVVPTADLVARAVATLSPAIEETGAEVQVLGELPEVRGEASLLALVFQNLIGNGLKFRGEAAPRITVGAERDGGQWRFAVADNGIGIEPEYADRIFIIFQRLHPRTSYEGTGIGLAMCRKVIEYHGGRIWLETGDGDGSGATFRFTLPAIDDDQEAPTP